MDNPTNTSMFFTLPPEFRNSVYRRHFTQAIESAIPPKAQNSSNAVYIPATALRETIEIFLVSRQFYNETHGLFFADFSVGARFSLQTRSSIYAFTRLPTSWTQGLHRIALTTNNLDRSRVRQTLNPIKVALKQGLSRTGEYNTVKIRRIQSAKTGWIKVDMQLEGEDVELKVSICRRDGLIARLTGPIAKLDWSLIPTMRYLREQKGWQVSGAVRTGNVARDRRSRRRRGFGEDERLEAAFPKGPGKRRMTEVQKLIFEAWQELEEYLSKPGDVKAIAFGRRFSLLRYD